MKNMLHPAFKDSRLKQLISYPHLYPYYDTVRDYLAFLHDSSKTTIRISGVVVQDGMGDAITIDRPYRHRWTEPYRKGRVAKGYQLEKYLHDNPSPTTLLTLTGFHDYNKFGRKVNSGHTLVTTYDSIKYGYQCLRKMIRKDYPSLQWFWTWEPHETGYPHLHAAVLGEFRDSDIDRYKDHWSKKLRIGDREHGLDFEVDYKDNIQSIRNYLVGYCVKTLSIGINDWTPAELTFNAVTWRHKFRTFGATQELAHIMKMPDYHHNFYWVATDVFADLPGCLIEKTVGKTTNESLLRAYETLSG